MKKVRISIRDATQQWSFPMYESLESLEAFIYIYEDLAADSMLQETITLKKGEFLEIEWLGADYCQIDEFGLFLDEKNSYPQMTHYYDKVRIGKSVRKGDRKGFEYITGFTGWVPCNLIPWAARNTLGYLKVIELNGRYKPRIDFSELFVVKSEATDDMTSNAEETVIN